MSEIVTDRDVRFQVVQATDASEGSYNVDAIVEEVVHTYGRVNIDTIDHDAFWSIVLNHAVD